MPASQQIPAPRGVTPDHDRAASFLSTVRGEAVSVNSPYVNQLVDMIARARAEAFLQAAVQADADRERLFHAQVQERLAADQAARVTAEIEYRHPMGRYGQELAP